MTVGVAIDVGGTKTAIAAIAFPDLRVMDRVEQPTPPRELSGKSFLEASAATAISLARRFDAAAIGLSVCELVDPVGAIQSSHRILWKGLSLHEGFAGETPVLVESDVRAGAVAEARFGAGRPFADIFYVNLGTGVSSCWVRDGRPHRGARGNAILLANSPIDAVCDHCGEPSSTILEDEAGAAGLLRRYRQAGGSSDTARDIFRAADQGNRRAENILTRAAHLLGVSIGLAVNLLDPEAVVLGGGLAHAGGAYGAPLDDSIRRHVWAPDTKPLPIVRSELGADSALIGAAALALDVARAR